MQLSHIGEQICPFIDFGSGKFENKFKWVPNNRISCIHSISLVFCGNVYTHLYIKHRSFCSYISHSHLKPFYQFATYWLYEIVLAQSIYHDGNFTEIILKQHLPLTTMSQIISISLLVTLCIVNKKNIDCKMKTQLSIIILWISERNYIRILCNFAQHDEKKQHILSVN